MRQRHGLPGGDLDRIVRQQVFMAAVANKLLSTGTLTDPAKLAGLQDAARRSVVLDENWDVAEDTLERAANAAARAWWCGEVD